MNIVNILKKQSRLFLVVLCTLLFFQTTNVSAGDPSNCEDCYELPEDQIDDCLNSGSCNAVPVTGNIWVLMVAGAVLLVASKGYFKKKEEEV